MRAITLASILFIVIISTDTFANDNQTQIENAKIKIRNILKDADSAKFQNLSVVTNSKGDESICGEVNAKNSFGGYTGYAKFSVSGNTVNIIDQNQQTSIKLYNLCGCAGPEAELEDRLENEAIFNCNVIWTMLSNVIVENQTKEEAVETAIIATKNRAKENGTDLADSQIQMIRSQYMQSLEQTLADKKQVKAIKKDPAYQKKIFIQFALQILRIF